MQANELERLAIIIVNRLNREEARELHEAVRLTPMGLTAALLRAVNIRQSDDSHRDLAKGR